MKTRALKGLSLLEIVISLTILVIVFFTIYQIFTLGFRAYRTSMYSTELMKLAQKRLEEIVEDRNPNGPQEVTSWEPIPDTQYMYMVEVEFYNTTGPSGFDPPANPHTPYWSDPNPPYINYDMYAVTFTAKGPMNPDLSEGIQTKTIVLRTLIAPSATYFVGKCRRDENNTSGGSDLWMRLEDGYGE